MVQDKSSRKKKATTKVTGQNSLGKGVTCFGCAGRAHVYPVPASRQFPDWLFHGDSARFSRDRWFTPESIE